MKVPLDPISNSAWQSPLCKTVDGPHLTNPALVVYYYWDCNTSLVLKAVMAGIFWIKKSSIVAVFFFILALNTPSATAAEDLPVMKLNLQQTRKRCKRPSAKRAPGKHPGLFQISRLFRARFSADVSPGQEEQPMFWFKDKYCIIGIVVWIFGLRKYWQF